MLKKTLTTLLLAGLLSGCGDGASEVPAVPEAKIAGHFNLPVPVVYALLIESKLIDLRINYNCGLPLKVTARGIPNQSITWYVKGDKTEEFFVTIHLKPDGDKATQATLVFPKGIGGGEAYDGKQTYKRPAFRQPLRPVVEEQMAATVENRAFNIEKLPKAEDKTCDKQKTTEESKTVNPDYKPAAVAVEQKKQ